MNIEETLQNINFYQNSKVKTSLRQKLLINRKHNLDTDELSMDELDNVVAAMKISLYDKKNNIK